MRAVQTASAYDYRIPDAGDELEINHDEFQLRGWVENLDSNEGLDKSDPWSGDIRYPPPMPAPFVIDGMHLQADSERRIWRDTTNGHVRNALWSQLWGKWSERRDHEEGDHGRRLQASTDFIAAFLSEMDMDLIIKVQLDRRLRNRHYERSENGDIGFVPPSARLFLFKPDGSLSSL